LLTTLFGLQPNKIASAITSSRIKLSINTTTQLETITTTTIKTTKPKLEEVRVNMAEMRAENKPVELVTSVGSCVAICLYDSVNMCGGLAHIMLPKSAIAQHEPLPAKFADTAVPALAEAVRKLGRKEGRLSAKIAGGANMFPNMNALNIGMKNIEAVKTALAEHKIRLIAENVGDTHGRRVTFDTTTGSATVKRFNGEVTKL
jgi:chemotaxis protein CheD